MKKRIISFLLALTLCLGLLPAPVFAEEAPTNQTLAETPVSQNEEPQEPQPEPAPQNEEGREPQPISQNQEGQEPQQEPAPQNGEAGEPQPEPAPQNGEGQEPQGAPEQGKPQGEPEQGEPQGEPEQGEPQEEPEQGELPVQNVLKANAPMAVAEGEPGGKVTLYAGAQEGKLFAGVGGNATFWVECDNGDLKSPGPNHAPNLKSLREMRAF